MGILWRKPEILISWIILVATIAGGAAAPVIAQVPAPSRPQAEQCLSCNRIGDQLARLHSQLREVIEATERLQESQASGYRLTLEQAETLRRDSLRRQRLEESQRLLSALSCRKDDRREPAFRFEAMLLPSSQRSASLGRNPWEVPRLGGILSAASFQLLDVTSLTPEEIMACYPQGASPEQSSQCLTDAYKRKMSENGPAAMASFTGMTIPEIRAILAGTDHANLTDEELRAGLAYFRFILAPDARRGLELMRAEGRALPVGRRVELLQAIGRHFLEGYDELRAGGDRSHEQGVVTLDQLLRSGQSRLYGNANDAGICRDMASAQGEVAQALGFDNVYVVGYFTRGGGGHATLYAEDPDDREKIYLINYGQAVESRGTRGAAALQQPWDGQQGDGLSYRISKPGGEQVAVIPSRLQQYLRYGLQGQQGLERVTPAAILDGSVLDARADLGRGLQASLYRFDDPTTGNVGVGYGVSATIDRPRFTGTAGVSHTQVETRGSRKFDDATYGYAEAGRIRMDDVFAVFDAQVRSPFFRPSDSARIQAFAEGSVSVLLSQSSEAPGTLKDAEGHGAIGARGEIGSPEGRFQARASVSEQFSIATRDVRSGSTNIQDGYWLRPDRTVIDFAAMWRLARTPRGRAELERSETGRAYLFGMMTAVVDHWGPVIAARAGIGSPAGDIRFGIRGSIRDDVPRFVENSQRQLGVEATRNVGSSGSSLGAVILVPLQGDGERPRFGINGRVTVPAPRLRRRR